MAEGPHIHFGRKITARRQKLGWSVSKAAREMSVARPALSRWEHGHELPNGENMIKLRDHLEVPIGTNEVAQQANRGAQIGCQLTLPFDQAANLELKVTRRTQDVVELELRLRGLAS